MYVAIQILEMNLLVSHALLQWCNFLNIQMAHGGTNFEFFNGANTGQNESDYKADLTSYDYVSNACWECCMMFWNF